MITGNDDSPRPAGVKDSGQRRRPRLRKSVMILMADDDADDRTLTKEALEECKLVNEIRFVPDGEELMDYLYHRGRFSDWGSAPRPGVILLDLNMPRKDGREALREIKSDPNLRRIPVIVMTTSKSEEDICRTYDLGANSYITKPVTFNGLVEVMRALGQYWFEIVEIPELELPGSRQDN